MEVLGAVAASVQLAQLCYQTQQRLRQLSPDRELIGIIKAECERMEMTVEAQRDNLTPEGREASIHLGKGLKDILASIRKLERRTGFARLVGRLELQGPGFKNRLDIVLLEYQSMIAIATDAAVKSIRDRVGPEGLPAEVEQQIIPVQSALASLREQNGELEALLRANQGIASDIAIELSTIIVNTA